MSFSPPAAKKPKIASEKQISDLADTDLSEIFKQLSPHDRLITSEVCRRFYGLSRKAWLDVTNLDLSTIPGKHIGAIVHQCPNLKSVFAFKKSFGFNELACLPQASQLSTVKLYDCRFAVKSEPKVVNDGFVKIFSPNLTQASWSELVLHNACLDDKTVFPMDPSHEMEFPRWAFSGEYLPATLKRLQLSGLRVSVQAFWSGNIFLTSLDRLQNLECFMLYNIPVNLPDHQTGFVRVNLSKLCALQNLKELGLGPVTDIILGRLVTSLPKLEVLFLNNINGDNIKDDLKELIAKNTVLRILVLSGKVRRIWGQAAAAEPIELPARKRFPHGFGSDPLPLLHIFVGKEASEKLRFAKSASDAAVVYPINVPMPEFLDRVDVAPIFDGVWVAAKIKEAAATGGKLWNYDVEDTACSVESY